MNNVIIGTAGHVDHGKTMLVKALTGIDTDRLKEEKAHGITIELGFAWLDLPDGERAGIIDVPGHEKFVKNMLAGAGGIDIALLVIAADDGVMPQTKEHLGILSLLDIKEGIIVLTKSDLVDEEWAQMVISDIKKEVEGTFLQEAPIISVSARTGQGIEELKELIYRQVGKAAAKNTAKPFRIPVDRVFSIGGFGTVITGSLIEGTLSVGDEVEVYPSGIRTRVRNLQVHSKDVQTAFAGQRVAANLAGIKKEEVARGDTLAVPDSMQNTRMLDVKLRILKDSKHVVANGSRLHFYHGAGDVLCKLVLLEEDELNPGQEGYAQLRFTEEIAVKKSDHFVVRFYSPVDTVGGGVVLDPHPLRHRRKVKSVLEALRVRELGSVSDNLLQAIADGSPKLATLADIQTHLLLDNEAFQRELAELTGDGRALLLTDKIAISASYKTDLGRSLAKILGDYHRANPLQAGMQRNELRSRLLPGKDIALADKVLALFAQDGAIVLDNQKAALAGFKIQYSGGDKKIADDIESRFRQAGCAPPSFDEIYALYPKEKSKIKQLLGAMLANGVLIATDQQTCFYGEVLLQAQEKITAFIGENGQITLAEFRDLSGTSRKFALALLEYFDRHGITKKVGDSRVLAKK